MNKLIIICHTWRDTDMTIEHFHTEEKALKFLGETVEDHYRTPYPDEDIEEFIEEYNECESVTDYQNFYFAVKIVELN